VPGVEHAEGNRTCDERSLCEHRVSLFRSVLQGVFRRIRGRTGNFPSLEVPEIVIAAPNGWSRFRIPYSPEQGVSRELIPSRNPFRCRLGLPFSDAAVLATRFGRWQGGQEIVVASGSN